MKWKLSNGGSTKLKMNGTVATARKLQGRERKKEVDGSPEKRSEIAVGRKHVVFSSFTLRKTEMVEDQTVWRDLISRLQRQVEQNCVALGGSQAQTRLKRMKVL